MTFSGMTPYNASLRQDKFDGKGTWCARCCENIGLANEYAIPRIPIAQGGKKNIDNCVILCEKCFQEIGFDHPDVIPYTDLPCFKV